MQRLSYYKDTVNLPDVFLNEESNDLTDVKDLSFSFSKKKVDCLIQ